MDKFLDAFASFPAKFKYLILVGIIALLVGLFIWQVFLPKQEEIERLEADLQKLQIELQKAEAKGAKRD